MRRFLAAVLAFGLAAFPIAASAQLQVNAGAQVNLRDPGTGAPIGVSANPLVVTGSSGGGGSAAPYVFTSTGFQQVAAFSTSTGFTPPALTTVCFIQAEGNSVRFRTDGTAPTATVGQLLPTNTLMPDTANLSGIRFIPTTGTAALDVDCYK